MREIKFRVWDKRNKKMLLDPKDIRLNIANGDLHGKHSGGNVKEWEAMQYIGIKDSNGIGVFEGDLLEQDGFVYRVEWHNAMCCFVGSTNDGDYEIFSYVLRKNMYKVVGNIHENKELLS